MGKMVKFDIYSRLINYFGENLSKCGAFFVNYIKIELMEVSIFAHVISLHRQ